MRAASTQPAVSVNTATRNQPESAPGCLSSERIVCSKGTCMLLGGLPPKETA